MGAKWVYCRFILNNAPPISMPRSPHMHASWERGLIISPPFIRLIETYTNDPIRKYKDDIINQLKFASSNP